MTVKKQRRKREVHPELRGFGDRLKLALGEEEQKWLAEHSGVDRGGISRYLRGHGLVGLSASTVIQLARALGVRPGWLLANDGMMRGEWREVEAEPSQPVAQKRERALKRGK